MLKISDKNRVSLFDIAAVCGWIAGAGLFIYLQWGAFL